MPPSREEFHTTVERFTGWADLYDRHRPEPPARLAGLLCQLGGFTRPDLVVDLGAGTGLSTRYWASRAREVIGIEPTPDMRRTAAARTAAANVTYWEGFSHETGLPDGCAQIVSCSQALHWMEPESTFAEAARVLQPGGLFAAYDYDWPPTTGRWEVDVAYLECIRRAEAIERALGFSSGLRQWKDKERHLERMQSSGRFRHTKEVVLDHEDTGNAERLVGVLLGQGGVAGVMKRGRTEAELGIDRFRKLAGEILGAEPRTWHWSSRVRIGIV